MKRSGMLSLLLLAAIVTCYAVAQPGDRAPGEVAEQYRTKIEAIPVREAAAILRAAAVAEVQPRPADRAYCVVFAFEGREYAALSAIGSKQFTLKHSATVTHVETQPTDTKAQDQQGESEQTFLGGRLYDAPNGVSLNQHVQSHEADQRRRGRHCDESSTRAEGRRGA